jgi:alanine dehydrogenase
VLLLTQDDLRPLIDSNEQLVRAFERLEKAILHQKHDPPEQGVRAEIPLEEDRLHLLRLTPVPDAITVRWDANRGEPPTANANLLLLFDPRNGELLALIAADDLNPLRTALPTAVGVRRLAAPGASVLAVLGSGRQAWGHLRAYHAALPGLSEVRIHSSAPNGEQLAEEARQRYGFRAVAVDSIRTAVEGADVVVSLVDATFETAWLQPGTLVVQLTTSGVPSDLANLARVVVPVRQPTEVIPLSSGGQSGPPQDPGPTDLGDIIQEIAPARERADELVLWDMSAPRPWDPPITNWAYKWALEQGVGMRFNLSSTVP